MTIQDIQGENLVDSYLKQSQEWASEYGMELHPFRVGVYNDKVTQEYKLNYPADTIVFLAISSPDMFEKTFLPFLRTSIESVKADTIVDPLDQCMKNCFGSLKHKMETVFERSIDLIHDFELQMPSRRPKVLLQTAAHVSGAAFYYKRDDRFKLHRLGVCIHPKYGGWFGIRAVLIFPGLTSPNFVECPPVDVLPESEQRTELLCLFNDHWQTGEYRDIIPVVQRYSQLQIDYFRLRPRERIDFIKTRI